MILYHGSYLEIPDPDVKHSRTGVLHNASA